MTPHTIHARLTYARHSLADGHFPAVALLDLSRTIKGHRTMTQHTYTHGPWRQGKAGDKVYANIIGGDGLLVADCGSRSDLRAQANAQHIVACVNACEGINPDAVPDLLAALEAIEQHAFDDDTHISDILADFENMRDIARTAIAKATGTNPAESP